MSLRALILAALVVLAAGCSSARPVQPALAPSEPALPPNVAAPGSDPAPLPATPPAPDGAAPSTPLAPRPKTSARPPVITSRLANEEEIARAVNVRLTKVNGIVDRIDPSKLTRDQRELFASLQEFVAKAKEALRTRDLPQAQVLVDKALGLADSLAPR